MSERQSTDAFVVSALQEALTFIQAPRRMQRVGNDQTELTYRTNRYNAMTAKLREAIAKAGVSA